MLAYLVAIAALDSLNPTTTAFQIYLLSTPKPVYRSVSFIAGVFITYWAAGLVVVLNIFLVADAIAFFLRQPIF